MASATLPQQRTLLGHPTGLFVLFFTEMWERFSYYGMRALLVLYMVDDFRWTQKDASVVYKWYTSLVYVTPIVGGFLADRYLGNRLAVIIGAALMAVGHFLMASEEVSIFFAALVFLILGNGFFKPNMSTQVGRLYPTNDPRRDAAYTIFYMGINLGAFLSPLACGWLAQNTEGGNHAGFTLAGIGMVIGMVTYLLGQGLLKEIDPKIVYEGPATAADAAAEKPLTEAEAENVPSALGGLGRVAPTLLYAAGLVLTVVAGYLAFEDLRAAKWDVNTKVALKVGLTVAPSLLAGVSLALCGWVAGKVHNAVRDRVLTIVTLGVFVVFFWAAFEQAGNALTLWADKNTNRYLTRPMDAPPVYPEAETVSDAQAARGKKTLGERLSTMFRLKAKAKPDEAVDLGKTVNPVPTAWFQSINALAIFVMAPGFAWLWTRVRISVPTKMTLGIFIQALSFVVMVQAARLEDGPTSTPYSGPLPVGVVAGDGGKLFEAVTADSGKVEREPLQAGRMTFADGTLSINGVLSSLERDRIAVATAPAFLKKQVADAAKELGKQDEENEKRPDVDKKPLEAKVVFERDVPGFDLRYSGFSPKQVTYDAATRTLTVRRTLADKDQKTLLAAAGDPTLRTATDKLMVESGKYRVSSQWLLWCYVLATMAELCLSPVGLSMVSKLAPAKYATMLMGMWLLVSAFGNFAAGALGELWGTVSPVPYFAWTAGALAIAGVVLFVLIRKVVAMMHGVK